MSQIYLITGASGFVGRALCAALSRRGTQPKVVVRNRQIVPTPAEAVLVDAINGSTEWGRDLIGVDVVIHLAARVHVMKDLSTDPLSEFRKVNVEGTEHLARCAAASGVKRIVYVSSIKVNGEHTQSGSCYTEQDLPCPKDPYGVSKWEAEQALCRVAAETGLEVVIVRPPLIYGAEVKGNFALMAKSILKGIPLPFASVKNLRSLVYIENLVEALIICATHPAAAGQTYLISDGEDISTPELMRSLGAGMGLRARLFSSPSCLLEWSGAMVGKSDQIQRLLGSLQVDSGKIRRELNWTPPYTLQQGLQATAEWYRNTHL